MHLALTRGTQFRNLWACHPLIIEWHMALSFCDTSVAVTSYDIRLPRHFGPIPLRDFFMLHDPKLPKPEVPKCQRHLALIISDTWPSSISSCDNTMMSGHHIRFGRSSFKRYSCSTLKAPKRQNWLHLQTWLKGFWSWQMDKF
jgi:hypothetical protein